MIAVIGAGTMGAGIAQVCAAAGRRVVLHDSDPAAEARSRSSIRASLARMERKGSVTAAEAEDVLGRVRFAGDLDALAHCEVVIEAVSENIAVKRSVWRDIDRIAPAGVLLASNTSSLAITALGSFTSRPQDVCGLHFFNPVPVLPLVEVVRGLRSSPESVEKALDFVRAIGKTPILCEDRPGFIVNRLLIPYLNDAVHALQEGVASAEDIDGALRLGANMPIGPLALIDLVGLDVALAAAESLHQEFGDPKFRPAPLLRQMVRAGKLGRKSGEGFFRYPPSEGKTGTRAKEES